MAWCNKCGQMHESSTCPPRIQELKFPEQEITLRRMRVEMPTTPKCPICGCKSWELQDMNRYQNAFAFANVFSDNEGKSVCQGCGFVASFRKG